MILLSSHPSTLNNVSAALKSQNGSAVYVSEESDGVRDDNPQPAEVPNTNIPEPIVRHSEFFLDETMIVIQIENTLFKVHKYQLAKSNFFSELFRLSQSKSNKPEEGSSPEHPIVIRGAAVSDFAALLKVLYASHFTSNPPTPEASLIIPAFRLANLLNFAELRAYLLPLAEKNLDDVDKIVFAREFGIKEWLAPAYTRLCKRATVLSTEEASKLGVHSVVLIWRVREQYISQNGATSGGHYCGNCIVRTKAMGTAICRHCGSQTNLHYSGLALAGAGTHARTHTGSSTLEAEVEKWVEEDYTANHE